MKRIAKVFTKTFVACMHPNPIFRKTNTEQSVTMARARSFGTLVINDDPVTLLAHVPFLLSDEAETAGLHLVRSNPIARALKNGPLPAKLSIQGPDSYISPDWYGIADQVPTWNYVAVHFSGTLEVMPEDTLPSLLADQTAHFESQLAPQAPWIAEKMSEGVMDKMMRTIVPMRLTITDMQSTWKLGQNKDDAAREAAAIEVQRYGIGQNVETLGGLMFRPPQTHQQET